MTNWQTSNAPAWYIKLYWAVWNSIIALWDDARVTWDAINNGDWKTENDPNWKSKNTGDWKTRNTGTWYTKN